MFIEIRKTFQIQKILILTDLHQEVTKDILSLLFPSALVLEIVSVCTRFQFSNNKYILKPFLNIFIGQKFAMLETKLTVAKFLLHYKLLPAENSNLVLQGDLILKSATGVYVKIVNR